MRVPPVGSSWMGRKSRKGKQQSAEEIPSDSSDENTKEEGKKCPHVKTGVNSNVRKLLRGSPLGKCTTCQKLLSKGDLSEIPPCTSVCFCLQCGHQGCDRSSPGRHALTHFETDRSDVHSVCLNLSTLVVWCYECDDEVTSKKLKDAVNLIKKQLETSDCRSIPEPPAKSDDNNNRVNEGEDNGTSKGKFTRTINNNQSSLNSDTSDRIKGLNNLGNTCFFNAVLQNLCQTPGLGILLEEHTRKEKVLRLPGSSESMVDMLENVSDSEDDKVDNSLGPIELRLAEGGSLSQAVQSFLNEMYSSSSKKMSLNPNALFGQICKKAPRFRGFQQQDSHELLRHLLDGMKAEEMKRSQHAILSHFNLSLTANPKTIEDALKVKVRGYGKQAKHTFVDQIFGGVLLSTVTCLECKTCSQILEPCLDLSLPISEEKPARILHGTKSQREVVESPSTPKMSKYQMKKAKQVEKKNKKRGRQQQQPPPSSEETNHNGPEKTNEEDSLVNDSGSESDGVEDADVEDNATGDTSPLSPGPEDCDSVKQVATEISKLEIVDAADAKGNQMEKECIKHRAVKPLVPRHGATGASNGPSQECSILSCLNQFTATELLTGANRFGCSACTKKKNNNCQPDAKKQTVYCDASKQYLIYQPPAVLTLHVKRFQQVGYSFRKISRHVEFPLIFDLAPYCSQLCRGIKPKQKKILYSLYGVVEHHGQLSGGHYVAYVKVRPSSDRWKEFLNLNHPKTRVEELTDDDGSAEEQQADLQGSEQVVGGKWYYVSDSHVSEVPESKVLQAQAYLLFYERIL